MRRFAILLIPIFGIGCGASQEETFAKGVVREAPARLRVVAIDATPAKVSVGGFPLPVAEAGSAAPFTPQRAGRTTVVIDGRSVPVTLSAGKSLSVVVVGKDAPILVTGESSAKIASGAGVSVVRVGRKSAVVAPVKSLAVGSSTVEGVTFDAADRATYSVFIPAEGRRFRPFAAPNVSTVRPAGAAAGVGG